MRQLVHAALADHGLLLPPSDLREACRVVDAAGGAEFDRYLALCGPAGRTWERGCADLALPLEAIFRTLGFGAWQTRIFAPRAGAADRGAAGALFNLGVVLFDAVLDSRPAEPDRPLLNAAAMRALAEDIPLRPAADGDAPFAFFATVARAFFASVRDRDAGTRERMMRLLDAMLAAEVASTAARGATRAGLRTWRQLRRKSVWPFLLMAAAAGARPGSVEWRRARCFGEAVWIVDDLWDAADDWRAGTWSRPWWRLARCAGVADRPCDDALAALWRHGLPRAEDVRLRRAIRGFLAATDAPDSRTCLGATLGAWSG